MNLDQSIKNIDQVVANAPMTRYDHDQLKSDLALLVARVEWAEEIIRESQECDAAKKEVVVEDGDIIEVK